MIKVSELTKEFDGYKAVDNVSCEIPDGCIYGMVGSNGAGKSTFLRMLSGVYKQNSGSILYDGEPVYENVAVKKRIAFVADDLYFINNATMDRMAQCYASFYKSFDYDRYRNLTQAFKLNPKKSLNTFSKGMRRQASIILAISTKPDYLFLDETFDGLDPVMRNLVKSLICRDVEERKATAILTSHSLRELEDTCDQLGLLHKGGLLLESDISDIKTSLFKIQVAFSQPFSKDNFAGMDILHFEKQGSVANIIMKGDMERSRLAILDMNPLFLDMLPLTLEEVFTYEMEALGYSFDIGLLNEEGNGGEQ